MSTITTITTPQYTLVYEVNIEVQHDTRDAYLAWLDSHTNEILALEGFLGCTVFTRAPQDEGKEDQGWSLITVQYRLNDRSSLDKYFAEHAPRLRQDGINRFGDKFRASRRILSVQWEKTSNKN